YDGRELGEFIHRLRPPLDVVSLKGMAIASGADMRHFFNATRSPRSALHVGKRLLRHFRDLVLHGRGMQLVNGNALVTRLLRGALRLLVCPTHPAPAVRLVTRSEKIRGAVLRIDGRQTQIIARRGVMLATSAFPPDVMRIAAM